jgi:Rad3-related DNA helicase
MHAKAFRQDFFLWPGPLFSRLVEALTLMALAVLLPVAPLTCAFLSGRWNYLKHYRVTVGRSARHVRALGQARVVSRNLQRKLALPASGAETIEGECTHCGRCCVNRSCVFLDWRDDGTSHCAIYNNWFWKLTSCGSYPVDAQSIATYSCPSFKSVPIKVVARR